jgi:hypothetical protein
MRTRAGKRRGIADFFRSVLSPQSSILSVSVRDAWLAHERYVGRQVTVAGVVQVFQARTPDEYFTLDEGPNRIGLRGEAAVLRAQVGHRVAATGLLSFKPGVGIFLDAESIEED